MHRSLTQQSPSYIQLSRLPNDGESAEEFEVFNWSHDNSPAVESINDFGAVVLTHNEPNSGSRADRGFSESYETGSDYEGEHYGDMGTLQADDQEPLNVGSHDDHVVPPRSSSSVITQGERAEDHLDHLKLDRTQRFLHWAMDKWVFEIVASFISAACLMGIAITLALQR